MSRVTLGRCLIAVMVGGLALFWAGGSPSGAPPDIEKLLVGKWNGEIQGAFAGNRARVLVIDGVGDGTANGRFGLSEDRLGKVPISVQHTGNDLTLEFTVTARDTLNIPWRLRLESPGVLVGTVYQPVRGAPGRIEYPATFRRAE
jgi:hypothetical protein